MTAALLLLLSALPGAHASDAASQGCADLSLQELETPVTRDNIREHTERVFLGYRSGDVRVVNSARCDLHAIWDFDGDAHPLKGRVSEELVRGDVARIHLANAVIAQMLGQPEAEILSHLAASRSAQSFTRDTLMLMIEDEALANLYDQADHSSPHADRLPPAFAGQVQINGEAHADLETEPFVVQVLSDRTGMPRATYYVSPLLGAPAPEKHGVDYLRQRPVLIAGIAVSLAGAGTSYAIARRCKEAATAPWEPRTGKVSYVGCAPAAGGETLNGDFEGSDLSIGAWEDYARKARIRNNIAVAGTGVFTAAALGLGVQLYWSF